MKPFLIAVVLFTVAGACLPAVTRAHPRHAAYTTVARVTYYDQAGVTASGTYTTPGRTAGCPPADLGATVTILDLGLVFQCEDTGAPWYFADGVMKVDVFSYGRPSWLQQDFYAVDVEP